MKQAERRLTVIGIAWFAYGASTILHELEHAAAGLAVGGNPTPVSTTDVRE